MTEADFRHSIQASNQDPIPRDIVLQVRLEEQGAMAVLQRLYREVEILAPLLARDRALVRLVFAGDGLVGLDASERGLTDPEAPTNSAAFADDGSDVKFCSTCAFGAIFAVRGGTVKTSVIDSLGREQVLGFYLPGEMVGLNAIHPDRYPCDAIALDSVYRCRFSFPALAPRAKSN